MVVTSTVLDGLLCLLLISAAVVTATTATPREPVGEGRASDVASTLTTTTASVNYTLTPRFETTRVDAPNDATFDRTAHGTLAELLARAAVARITVDGERLSYARDGFGRAVVRAVRGAIQANHTRITAVWQPYPESSVVGRLVVGDRPPPDRPVHAAAVAVPSGFPTRERAIRRAARNREVDGVADTAADGIVAGLFPPTRTRIAASGTTPSAALIRHRYHRTAHRIGSAPPTDLGDGGVEAANERLETALAERVARDLRTRNTSATAAADAARLGRVRIVVRTWP
ncbi:MAG: hypothetical protein V5A16_02415 [Haloplanus sp.]